MPGCTDNSFTRPLFTARCPLAVLLRSAQNQLCCAYISGDSRPFSRHHVHRVSYYNLRPSRPPGVISRLQVSNRLQPVFFVRLSQHCTPCQQLCATHSDYSALFLGVILRLPVTNRLQRVFLGGQGSTARPPAPIRHPHRLPISVMAEIPPKRHVRVCLLLPRSTAVPTANTSQLPDKE